MDGWTNRQTDRWERWMRNRKRWKRDRHEEGRWVGEADE